MCAEQYYSVSGAGASLPLHMDERHEEAKGARGWADTYRRSAPRQRQRTRDAVGERSRETVVQCLHRHLVRVGVRARVRVRIRVRIRVRVRVRVGVRG